MTAFMAWFVGAPQSGQAGSPFSNGFSDGFG